MIGKGLLALSNLLKVSRSLFPDRGLCCLCTKLAVLRSADLPVNDRQFYDVDIKQGSGRYGPNPVFVCIGGRYFMNRTLWFQAIDIVPKVGDKLKKA